MIEQPKDIREVSVFRNGKSQAVRIPKEFEFSTGTVLMSKDADGTIHLTPKKPTMSIVELLDWLATQGPLDEDWNAPNDDDLLPLDEVRL